MPETSEGDARTLTDTEAPEASGGRRRASTSRSNGTARTSGTGKANGGDAVLQQELDRISLSQALIDTELATARVVDLTARLVEARQTNSSLRRELEELRIEYTQYRSEVAQMRASKAFKIAERIWSLRNALRG